MRLPGDEDLGNGSARIRPFLATSPSGPVPPAEPEPSTAPRPFVLTSGRVQADIGLETQVTVCPNAPGRLARLSREQLAILAICAQPVCVAEIAARLHLHLGVAKILVSDLSAAGCLVVHTEAIGPIDIDTIRRVIHGLRALA
jgi:Protein of unknown function (DUF742)